MSETTRVPIVILAKNWKKKIERIFVLGLFGAILFAIPFQYRQNRLEPQSVISSQDIEEQDFESSVPIELSEPNYPAEFDIVELA